MKSRANNLDLSLEYNNGAAVSVLSIFVCIQKYFDLFKNVHSHIHVNVNYDILSVTL